MVGLSSTKIVDSRAADHICNSFRWLRNIRRLNKGVHALRVGNGTNVWGEAVGEMTVCFDLDRIFVLVPSFKQNLISVSKLIDHGYFVSSILVLQSIEMETLFVLEHVR
jgi:hypothetical protein